MDRNYSIETKCIHSGWNPGNGEARQIPIYQSTTFKYDSADEMGKLFDLEAAGYFYTRLQNPTNDAVAARIADLEGGVPHRFAKRGIEIPDVCGNQRDTEKDHHQEEA